MGVLLMDAGEADEPLWDHEQVAAYLKISVETVKHRRAGLRRLARVQLGGLIRYRPADVRKFCERLAVESVRRPGFRSVA